MFGACWLLIGVCVVFVCVSFGDCGLLNVAWCLVVVVGCVRLRFACLSYVVVICVLSCGCARVVWCVMFALWYLMFALGIVCRCDCCVFVCFVCVA